MQIENAAQKLAELGHTTRLGIFRYLVKGGHQGVPVFFFLFFLLVP